MDPQQRIFQIIILIGVAWLFITAMSLIVDIWNGQNEAKVRAACFKRGYPMPYSVSQGSLFTAFQDVEAYCLTLVNGSIFMVRLNQSDFEEGDKDGDGKGIRAKIQGLDD